MDLEAVEKIAFIMFPSPILYSVVDLYRHACEHGPLMYNGMQLLGNLCDVHSQMLIIYLRRNHKLAFMQGIFQERARSTSDFVVLTE